MTTHNHLEVAKAPDRHPVDVAFIADTIQSIRLRLYPPKGELLTTLLDSVCGHVGLLLEERLGPDDAQRYVVIRTAKQTLAGVPRPDEPAAYRWRYVTALAAICDELLRRWITYAQPEGTYRLCCEPDGDGFYVTDGSGCIASRHAGWIARPARHLPLDEAAAFARNLTRAREIRKRQPVGRPC